MSQLLDENDELLASSAREMTLGTGSILAIFFGLVLLCGLFFGFGYNVGHKSASAALLSAAPAATTDAGSDETRASSNSTTFDRFKPAAGSANKLPVAAPEPEAPAPRTVAAAPEPHLAEGSTNVSPAAPATRTVASRPAAEKPPAHTVSETLPPPSVPATAGAGGTFVVQVAAVSHPEDASLLMGALRGRGYSVTQRAEPADKLIHIQVGPFASKAAADAMRQRLLGDGYNAIIK